jgi:enoyl-CoA hydratase/carnithine racemase
MAIAWAIRHPIEELRLLMQKIEVFFFAIRNSPMLPWHDKPPMVALMAGMAWMASMRIMLWCAIAAAALAIWRPMPQRGVGICCLGFLAAYAAPYLVGYGFERHVVPVLLPSALFLGSLWRVRLEQC